MRHTATVTIRPSYRLPGDPDPVINPTENVTITEVVGVELQIGSHGRDLIIRSAAVGSLGAQYVETKATYDAGTWTRLVLVNE